MRPSQLAGPASQPSPPPPSSSWREGGDDWHWPVSWAGLLGCWAAQCQAAGKLPFSYFFFFSNFLTFVWFNKNTKPFYLLMPIFIGASGIIPELLNKWHNFWTIFYIYNNIYPKQLIIGLTQMAKIKYPWAPKNIGLIFISVQYFQRVTWAFSWTLLEKFLFGSFSKWFWGFHRSPFQVKWNFKHDAHILMHD